MSERVLAALRAQEKPVCAYVYDRATLRERARAVKAALPEGALLAYAMKANGHPEVVAALAAEVDGIEVASGGELATAIAAPATKRVFFGGPAKTDGELAAAVRAGAVINAESVHELRRLSAIARDLAGAEPKSPVRVALRVNRAHAALPASIRMTGVPTPFGIDETQLSDAVAAATGDLELVGFHLHAVSNNLDAVAHAAFVVDAARWSIRAAAQLGVRLSLVNVGGGFGIDYTRTPAETPEPAETSLGRAPGGTARFDLSLFAERLRADLPELPPGARLVFEPGRFLAAPAGWYAAEVIDVKRTHGRWFAVLRGGTHHFRLPASWGYSHPFTVLPVEEWPYPFERPGVEDTTVDVAGELCNPRDVLARDAPVTRLRAGDVLVFANTGAYGWEVAHRDFLLHPYPKRIVL